MSLEFYGIPKIDKLKLIVNDAMHDDAFKMTYYVRCSTIPTQPGMEGVQQSRETFSHTSAMQIVDMFLHKNPQLQLGDTEYHFVAFTGNMDSVYQLASAVELAIVNYRFPPELDLNVSHVL